MRMITQLPPTTDLPGWVGPTVTILGALIVLMGVILGVVLRRPVAITDLWAENRSLRADMTAMDLKYSDKFKELASHQQTIGEGFIALSDTVEEAKVKLAFTPERSAAIEKARTLIYGDSLWESLATAT
jgi:hypothetical protein